MKLGGFYMMKKIETFTTNDLAIEYVALKSVMGYEPEFKMTEFMDFLTFFEQQAKGMSTQQSMVDGSHFELLGETMRANYRLNSYDSNLIQNYGEKVIEIRNIITDYLKRIPKQPIKIEDQLSEREWMKGKLVAAKMISYIWKDYIYNLAKKQQWPIQCQDINTYLLESDLAPMIGLPSIKEETLDFYTIASARIATLYHSNNDVRMTSSNGTLLAYSNYIRMIQGYESYVGRSFDVEYHPYNNKKRLLSVDILRDVFREIHEIDGFGICVDLEKKTDITREQIEEPKTKQLVYALNQAKRN